jgi:hypothetical protein
MTPPLRKNSRKMTAGQTTSLLSIHDKPAYALEELLKRTHMWMEGVYLGQVFLLVSRLRPG